MIDTRYNKIPYVQQWNLNIQRELPGNIVLDVGYVANKGTRQKDQELARVNQLPVSVLSQFGTTLNSTVSSAADAAKYGIPYPYPGFSGTVASALRQYPQIRANNTITDYAAPLGFSTYNSLQITVNKRLSTSPTRSITPGNRLPKRAEHRRNRCHLDLPPDRSPLQLKHAHYRFCARSRNLAVIHE